MSHWCQQEDLLIRCPVHGRHDRPELENVIGFIVNVLYLRLRVRSDDTLRELLSQADREMHSAFQHLDFDRVPDLMPDCWTELAFHWRSATRRERTVSQQPNVGRQVRTQPFFVRLPDWPWKFWSVFDDTPAGICLTVHYWPHVLAARTVEEFGRNIRAIAEALVERPLTRVDATISRADGATQ
jgi:hypothetical protein